MNTTQETLPVAKTIAAQLGRSTLALLGAESLVGDARSLMFSINGSPKKVNKIRVTLASDDTYTVEFMRYSRGTFECAVLAEVSMVYADSLGPVIQENTGLLTRLF